MRYPEPNNSNQKNKVLLAVFLLSIWGIMLVKTIFVSTNEPESFISPFYGIMLDNTWQSHFNVDLLLFCVVYGGWAIYREKSLLLGTVIGLFLVFFGGVFFFLTSCIIRSKGDLHLFFNGKNTSLN